MLIDTSALDDMLYADFQLILKELHYFLSVYLPENETEFIYSFVVLHPLYHHHHIHIYSADQ